MAGHPTMELGPHPMDPVEKWVFAPIPRTASARQADPPGNRAREFAHLSRDRLISVHPGNTGLAVVGRPSLPATRQPLTVRLRDHRKILFSDDSTHDHAHRRHRGRTRRT